MSEGLNLDLKKPLDKMTAKELRQLVMDKIPQITGASGMPKEEVLAAIKEVLGISGEDNAKGPCPYKRQIQAMKGEIRELRAKKTEITERKERDALRLKINKLKKRTRRLAEATA